MLLMGLSVVWTWLRNEQMSMNICMSMETSKTEMQRGKKNEKDRTEYSRAVGQLQYTGWEYQK